MTTAVDGYHWWSSSERSERTDETRRRTSQGDRKHQALIGQNLGDAEQERPMKTHDGLHLSVATYGPQDAPLKVFLAHRWTLNKHGWHSQVPIRLIRPHP